MHFVPAVLPPTQASAQHWCLAFIGTQLLVPEVAAQGTAAPLSLIEVADWQQLASTRHYLGRLDAADCWALQLAEPPPGWLPLPLRAAMLRLDPPLAALAGRAAQVLEWDRAHRFCGVCATPTERQSGERSRVCPACRHAVYPRINPAMMVLVWREGELLLARSPHYAAGMYSALAGFVEAGESLEECVTREVAEEVGVTVTDLRYFGSQSWPFPHSLMVAYTARWVGGEIVPQAGEIEDAQWFALDALPGVPPRFSIAGHLIRDTLAAMRGQVRP